jgi:hypothetical protein
MHSYERLRIDGMDSYARLCTHKRIENGFILCCRCSCCRLLPDPAASAPLLLMLLMQARVLLRLLLQLVLVLLLMLVLLHLQVQHRAASSSAAAAVAAAAFTAYDFFVAFEMGMRSAKTSVSFEVEYIMVMMHSNY